LDKRAYQIIDEKKLEEIGRTNSDIRENVANLSFDIDTDVDDEIREEDMSNITLKKFRVPCVLREVSTNDLYDLIDKINDTNFTNKKAIVEYLEK
jgi:flavodoxin